MKNKCQSMNICSNSQIVLNRFDKWNYANFLFCFSRLNVNINYVYFVSCI